MKDDLVVCLVLQFEYVVTYNSQSDMNFDKCCNVKFPFMDVVMQ